MHVGDHGAERELPLEAEPQINQDAEYREPQTDNAIREQLARHTRADHLDAAVIDGAAERAAHLGHRLLLGGIAAGLLGDADEHVIGRAELLQLHFA